MTSDKYCNKCGSRLITRSGVFNFDTETGLPKNKWWTLKCPNADNDVDEDYPHYYETYTDRKVPLLGKILAICILVAFILWVANL